MPKIKTKVTYILKIIFWILLIYVIYNLFKFIVRSMTNYDDYYYLENLFTHIKKSKNYANVLKKMLQ